jgi:hypothetical protein
VRISNLASAVTGNTQRINVDVRELGDMLSRRVDELHDEVGRNDMQFQRSLAAQESKFDTAIEAHDVQFKSQREHFTKVATATATLVADARKGMETTLSDNLTETRAELLDKIEEMGQQVDKNKVEAVDMHNDLKLSTRAEAQQWKENALELQTKMDIQQTQFISTTNDIQAEATQRDSREALRFETLSGMLEMEVKRVATGRTGDSIHIAACGDTKLH